LNLVVHSNVIDLPLCVREIRRICNCFRASPWATETGIDRTSPVTTEGRVERQDMVEKVFPDIARLCGPECRGRTPICGIWIASGDVGGNFAPGKVPSPDTLAVPQVSVDATTDVVETLPEAAVVSVDESAAVVV